MQWTFPIQNIPQTFPTENFTPEMFPVSVWTLVTLINPVTLVNLNDHPDINEIGMLKVHLVYITWVLNAYQPKPKKFKFRFRD